MDFAFDLEIFFIWRCHNIMKVAQAKIEMIKPEEVNMEEYEVMCLLGGWTVGWGILWFSILSFQHS